MDFKKFILIFIVSIAVPLIGLINNQYVHVNSFPYGHYVPATVAIGSFVFKILLVVGVIGLIVGLILPKLTYWGEAP